MRAWASIIAITAPLFAGDKLTFDDRVELTRGLMAEYATVKAFLPRSKKPLPFEANGTWDKAKWEETGKQLGPAARVGDMVQITKVTLESDSIVLELNGGLKSGRKWTDRIEIGMGSRTRPIGQSTGASPGGTTIELLFHKPLTAMKAAEVKKMLAPVLDFDKRSATEVYAETLPPEIKQAIAEKKAKEGMDREQVILALGRPTHKSREVKDGMELEDWVFGQPPGKIVFVTFNGSKVIKVKETYAGLGTVAAPQRTP